MIYFTADTHLGHANILRHQPNRPFATVEDMNAALLDAINTVVDRNDELWVLGDFAWKRPGVYRNAIRCRQVHLVLGNHDGASACFSSVSLMAYRKFGGHKFHLSHYPHASWRGRTHGSVHLYGHAHGSLEATLDKMWPERRAMDVGVDAVAPIVGAFRPVSLDEVLTWL
jgi:calcineurin-like phosphoesterase family protein